jgi:glycerol-3-phosphate dehydrogenase (NAD(P)+)
MSMAGHGIQQLAIIGAGSWGTALSLLFARNGVDCTIWGHLPDHMQQLQQQRSNEEFLPGFPFPENLKPCIELSEAVDDTRDILIVVPSHAFRAVLKQIQPLLKPDARIAWATKGLETGTGRLLHENAAEVLGDNIPFAVISGPTFAREVAAGLPTAITVASRDDQFAEDLAVTMCNETFRAYTSHDIPGVELGGAVKNVLAIAAGIADGLGFGANTRAALITRGLAEIMRLGQAIHGEPTTFMGLAGMGDLVLTCTDNQSRNRRFGLSLAQGMSQQQAVESIGQVVEGIQSASEVHRLSEKLGIDMPISSQVYRVLNEGIDPHTAVQELFAREIKPEF